MEVKVFGQGMLKKIMQMGEQPAISEAMAGGVKENVMYWNVQQQKIRGEKACSQVVTAVI